MNTANPLIPGAHAARSGTPSLRGLVIAAPQLSDGLALSLIGYRAGPGCTLCDAMTLHRFGIRSTPSLCPTRVIVPGEPLRAPRPRAAGVCELRDAQV
jgi:hypothetical protein